MRISPKTKVVNLQYTNLNGNVLDISLDDAGIIYNFIKNKGNDVLNLDDDISTKFDSTAIFFTLGSLSKTDSKKIIKEVYDLSNDSSCVYIWDRLKYKNEIVRDKIVVNLSPDVKKEFYLSNLNPFYEFNLDRIEKILEKKFLIEEKLIWDDVIYIKAKKIK